MLKGQLLLLQSPKQKSYHQRTLLSQRRANQPQILIEWMKKLTEITRTTLLVGLSTLSTGVNGAQNTGPPEKFFGTTRNCSSVSCLMKRLMTMTTFPKMTLMGQTLSCCLERLKGKARKIKLSSIFFSRNKKK